MQAKTFEPSYHTALKCIEYLSEDRRVAECRAFIVLSGNDKIKSWLDCVDRGEVRHVPLLLAAILKGMGCGGHFGIIVTVEVQQHVYNNYIFGSHVISTLPYILHDKLSHTHTLDVWHLYNYNVIHGNTPLCLSTKVSYRKEDLCLSYWE